MACIRFGRFGAADRTWISTPVPCPDASGRSRHYPIAHRPLPDPDLFGDVAKGGVVLFSVLPVRIHLARRRPELSWSILAAGGLLSGIGFTMALFIAELAFNSSLLNSAKLLV
jgi:hypothetical protein